MGPLRRSPLCPFQPGSVVQANTSPHTESRNQSRTNSKRSYGQIGGPVKAPALPLNYRAPHLSYHHLSQVIEVLGMVRGRDDHSSRS